MDAGLPDNPAHGRADGRPSPHVAEKLPPPICGENVADATGMAPPTTDRPNQGTAGDHESQHRGDRVTGGTGVLGKPSRAFPPERAPVAHPLPPAVLPRRATPDLRPAQRYLLWLTPGG